jgi:UDP-N-acetylglucosamine--N-acetylmuramyl-(pentapeptide) pyrophosphoryl-undecaprenol N-acetylglucosamine transferase
VPLGSPPRAAGDDLALRYIGQAGSIEEALVARASVPFAAVESGQIRGRAPWEAARSVARMRVGAAECTALIRDFRPDVAFVTGGYVAAPVAWAAWRAKVPLLIYLPDLEPGLEIRVTSRLASQIAVSVPEAAPYFRGKAIVTGYPVRRELWEADRVAARAVLGLDDDLPVLLVFGGSRGARSINRALMQALPTLLPRCQIVHISGELDWPEVSAVRESDASGDLLARYHAYPYLHDEMTQALAAADLVIARAGASTLGEFPALGLPAILVPYPHAGKHQYTNAAYLADRGAATIVEDSAVATALAPTVLDLLGNPERLAAMSRASRALARPDAADRIADLLITLADATSQN